MIFQELRSNESALSEDDVVTEAALRFAVHVNRDRLSQLMCVRYSYSVIDDKRGESNEHQFIFRLARKLGVSSLRVFTDSWQDFLTCQQLQQLIVTVAPTDDSSDPSPLAPELTRVIQSFYESQLFHDEDACLLLTKYLKSSDALYGRIVATILKNAQHYHSEALFQLAQLQAALTGRNREVMDSGVFAIVIKAFDNLSKSTTTSAKMLDYIDWLFLSLIHI